MELSRQAEKLYREALERLRSGRAAAFAAVVRVEGSAYRHEGARMLIRSPNDAIGSISGGCLETEVLAKARDTLETGAPALLRYDMRVENDEWWGIGSGCNGAVDILLYIPDPAVLSDLMDELAGQRPVHCVTALQAEDGKIQPGTQVLRLQNGQVRGPESLRKAVRGLPDGQWARRAPFTVSVPQESGGPPVSLFVERLEPSAIVLIVGSGADAEPMARMAADIGARVVVADHRSLRLNRTAFPDADEFVHATPENAPAALFGPQTCAVLMTHSFEWDARWLCRLLSAPVPYIGVLGPRARGERLLAELGRFGLQESTLLPDWRERVHNPLGLDLGGEGAGAVALAAAAEILAYAGGRDRSLVGARRPWKERVEA